MPSSRKPLWSRVLSVSILMAAVPVAAAFAAAALPAADPAERLLQSLHPDFGNYVGAVRPLAVAADGSVAPVYMALVRPGAADPTAAASAPFAGPGARNDILYDPRVIAAGRSEGWTLLLLDHEYFHARHLAGATSLPLPRDTGAAIEHHFCEAAAWGYTVEQAREGRYPGLRPDEFREALDRYGDHFRALRTMTRGSEAWTTLEAPLLQPAALVRTTGLSPAAAPSRPSDSDR
jgi:hypothetical protein